MYKTVFGVLILTAFSSAYAITGYGKCEYGKETLSNLKCFGPTKLAETTVSGNVSVAGPLNADNTTMHSMHVAGIANIKNSNVISNVQVAGVLNADHGNFDGDISLASEKAVMSHSMVKGSITVKSKREKAVLELLCGTKVTGDVTFEGLPGVIKKSETSVIEGKVNNGTVEAVPDKESC